MELIVISILATLIIVLVTIVLWFASRNRKLKDEQENKLILAIDKIEGQYDKLDNSHHELDNLVTRIAENVNGNLKICKLTHDSLNMILSTQDENIKSNHKYIKESMAKINEIEKRLIKVNGI